MTNFLLRVKVVLTALPTYLTAATAVVVIAREEIVGVLPEAWQGDASEIIVTVLAVLAAATNVIRRVTPVLPADRGLLPTPLEGAHVLNEGDVG